MEVLHVAESCPVCGEGAVGFFACSEARVVLMCDDCNSLWLDPGETASSSTALHADPPDYVVPGTGESISSPDALWADRELVQRLGFGERIAGETSPLSEW